MKQRHPPSPMRGKIPIILSKDVDNLGKKSDLIVVRTGYFMNYLLPRGIATRATDQITGNRRTVTRRLFARSNLANRSNMMMK
mmetsp:Transcript_13184/g.17085  ORF Transcript_13184/g.17085 Transcript_13184/m.17085 type:complete len:83 (-) Transcript_13184:230-478(-)